MIICGWIKLWRNLLFAFPSLVSKTFSLSQILKNICIRFRFLFFVQSRNFALIAMKLHAKTMLLIVIYPLETLFSIFFLFQCFSQIFCWTALSAAMHLWTWTVIESNRIEMHNDKIKLCAHAEAKAQDDCFLNLGIVIIVMFDALK